MSHEIFRLITSIANKPQLATQEYTDFALNFLIERHVTPEMALRRPHEQQEEELLYNEETAVGIIPVLGPLTYQPVMGVCGEVGYSYQRISAQFDQMVSMGAKTIVLDLDTPGGLAYGCFSTANYLRQEADRKGIRLIGYVDGCAASAGYGLAAACHEIISNPYAEVGSIGVVVGLANFNKAEKRVGIERSYIYAGKAKIPFDKNGDFTEEFLTDMQDKVDSLYLTFVSHVAGLRDLKAEDVADTEARMFSADKAKSLGLIDAIMEKEDFFDYLTERHESGNTMSLKDYVFGKPKATSTATEDVAQLEADVAVNKEMQDKLTQLTANFEAQGAELTAALAQIADKDASLSSLQGELDAALLKLGAIEAEAQAKAQAEAQAKLDARKASLTAALGDEQGATLFEATKGLEDAAFNLMVGSFKAKAAAESASPMFEEMGSGSMETINSDEDATTRLLSKLYGTNK